MPVNIVYGLVKIGISIALFGAILFYVLTMPRPLTEAVIPEHEPNQENGESLFWAGGCASCHAAPGSVGAEQFRLGGGVELKTPFGIFRSPNISPNPDSGIGKWTTLDFINAMVRGLSPEGEHYYPAFPYSSYRNIKTEDLVDLKAFLDTLPSVESNIPDHALNFPFTIRRGLGLWKLIYLNDETFQPDPELSASVERGRYLVRGPGHCSACHTPRDIFGGEKGDRFLAGAKSFENDSENDEASSGNIPNITPHEDGIGSWSEKDIAYALETGFDPDFDSFGGSMVEVQKNMAKLSENDRKAIAAYLKTIPAVASTVNN